MGTFSREKHYNEQTTAEKEHGTNGNILLKKLLPFLPGPEVSCFR